MKTPLIFVIITFMTIPLIANDWQFEVSKDGWQTAVIDKSQHGENMSFITDEVPYNTTPDWSCNRRMQVADLDGDVEIVQ